MTSGTWESSFHIIVTIVLCLTISVCMQLLQPFTWVSIIVAMLATKVALGDWDKEKDTMTEIDVAYWITLLCISSLGVLSVVVAKSNKMKFSLFKF